METLTLLVQLATYGVMWSLPVTFFRRDGRLNVRWALTALPFALGPGALVLAYLGIVETWPLGSVLEGLLRLVALAASAAAVAVVTWTVRTHEVPLALWHQDDDAPESLVTSGPYALVRHPFYAAFLLAMTGTLCAAPSGVLVLVFGYGVAVMNLTAAREERRLSASPFGAEYEAYIERTPRFVPRRPAG